MKKIFILLTLFLSTASWGYDSIKCESDEAFVEMYWSELFSYADNELTIEWGPLNLHYIFDNSGVISDLYNDGKITWVKKRIQIERDLTLDYFGSVNERSWVALKRGSNYLRLSCDS
jgi:hypothetical protein